MKKYLRNKINTEWLVSTLTCIAYEKISNKHYVCSCQLWFTFALQLPLSQEWYKKTSIQKMMLISACTEREVCVHLYACVKDTNNTVYLLL